MIHDSLFILTVQVNVLITCSRRACLADFGLSSTTDTETATLTQDSTANGKGTMRWLAPELFVSSESFDLQTRQRHNEATDIYAFACVCYEVWGLNISVFTAVSDEFQMFSGRNPFYNLSNAQVLVNVEKGNRPPRPLDDSSRLRGLSDEMWTLIETCWAQEPENRLGVEETVSRLEALAIPRDDDRPLDGSSLNHISHTLSNHTEHPFAALITNRQLPSTPQLLEKAFPKLYGDPVDARRDNEEPKSSCPFMTTIL
jgi:serine/threonine protein kinase